jgi:hypothetical protein
LEKEFLSGIIGLATPRGSPELKSGRRGSNPMAEKLNPKEVVSFEEVLLSNVYTQEALINLLEAKGIIKKAELMEEIKRLRDKENRGTGK